MSSTKAEKMTTAALKYYVPLYQLGDQAEEILLSYGDSLTPAEVHHYETLLKFKQLTIDKISTLAGPLITREINKIIKGSHLKGQDDLFNVLYYAGIDGMKKGLKKFEVDKINVSSTNYLFQWITTYAKKELVVLEAPFGIPPSRFQRYKKISAVRKKLTDEMGRYPTNDEIYDYFASGQADIKTLNGRVKDKNKPSKANQNITLDIIIEQERFEKEMLNVNLLDPLEDYSSEIKMSEKSELLFGETIFGVFCNEYDVTEEAKVVIMSDLGVSFMNDEDTVLLDSLDKKTYRLLSNQWKNLIKDKHGPFYEFLQKNKNNNFAQFDVESTLKVMDNYHRVINSDLYKVLFNERETQE